MDFDREDCDHLIDQDLEAALKVLEGGEQVQSYKYTINSYASRTEMFLDSDTDIQLHDVVIYCLYQTDVSCATTTVLTATPLPFIDVRWGAHGVAVG